MGKDTPPALSFFLDRYTTRKILTRLSHLASLNFIDERLSGLIVQIVSDVQTVQISEQVPTVSKAALSLAMGSPLLAVPFQNGVATMLRKKTWSLGEWFCSPM